MKKLEFFERGFAPPILTIRKGQRYRVLGIILTTFILFFHILLFGQKVNISKTNCLSYNKFIRSEKLNELKTLCDTIYPNGKIYFDPSKFDKNDDIRSIYPFLGLNNDMSFELVKETNSRFNENMKFARYQQFFKGIKVEGGGYTLSYMVVSTGVTGGPSSPCNRLYTMSPYLFTDIDIDVTPVIIENQLTSILDVIKINKSDLIIEQNLAGFCEYTLVWKVDYYKSGNFTSWVDAKNGNILKTMESTMYKNAPTEDYGIQDMDDSNQGNITRLVSQDGSIITYDFAQYNLYDGITPADYLENLIPISNSSNEWTTTNAPDHVFQAHWVTTNVKNLYQTLGINFNALHVAANCSNIWDGTESLNAFALNVSTLEEGYIAIGQSAGSTLAEYDVIGHELAHIYLHGFLDYDEGGNASLHEGISDMLGVYIEMLHNGGTPDWEMGDDIPKVIRDLEHPLFDCFDDVENFGFNLRHNRSTPLGHWFYLASAGGTPNLDVLSTVNIVLEALNDVGPDSDYDQLMQATLAVAEENFGICSIEFVAINNAWESICVETGFGFLNSQPCNYSISGPSSVCEESDYAQFCISGGFPNAHYRWYIIGDKSTEYKSYHGMVGNIQEGGNCLTLIDFPKYPYYPQYITIKVYSPTVGSKYTVSKQVKLNDCNHDDPTCEEYYNSIPFGNTISDLNYFSDENEDFSYCKVYNLFGNLIFEGNKSDIFKNQTYKDGLLFIVFLDQNGNIIKTEKEIILK